MSASGPELIQLPLRPIRLRKITCGGSRLVRIFQANRFALLAMPIILAACYEARGAERVKRGFARVNTTTLLRSEGQRLSSRFYQRRRPARQAWDNQFETFAKYYRVIRYDIRGIGKLPGRKARSLQPRSLCPAQVSSGIEGARRRVVVRGRRRYRFRPRSP